MTDHGDMTPAEEPSGDLPPELLEVLRNLTGGQVDPQMISMLRDMGLDQVDPAMLQMVGTQLRSMFASGSDGPVNVSAATDLARKVVATEGDPSMTPADQRAVAEAVDVARLWLDSVTDFQAHNVTTRAWSRAEWVEGTMPVWADVVEPLAAGVGAAVAKALRDQLGSLGEDGMPPGLLPEGLVPPGTDPMEAMAPMLAQMSSAMFSLQLGQGVGQLAGEVLSGTEVALPLVSGTTLAMLPTNIRAFADGLEIDPAEVRLYLAVRESARSRLFASVPWLGASVVAAVRDYAADIRIDTDAIEESMRGADLSDPAAMQAALQDNLFTPEPSPAGVAALARLETLLALIEGWVDVVTDRATTATLPHASALGEAVRRRRASGGPAERTFQNLVGLDLRPRRLRDAANLFAALEDRLGAAGRDAAWQHPDLAPGSADLDDILGYVDRAAGTGGRDEMDAALDALLSEGSSGSAGADDASPSDPT